MFSRSDPPPLWMHAGNFAYAAVCERRVATVMNPRLPAAICRFDVSFGSSERSIYVNRFVPGRESHRGGVIKDVVHAILRHLHIACRSCNPQVSKNALNKICNAEKRKHRCTRLDRLHSKSLASSPDSTTVDRNRPIKPVWPNCSGHRQLAKATQ